jgi:peptidyl-tRNA hydrolase ICT1
VYPVRDLQAILPSTLHAGIRQSKYYTAGNDSLTFHAQTFRSRDSNADENRKKLMDEVTRIYHENTPAETSSEKKQKHQDMSVKHAPWKSATWLTS